MSYKSLEIGSRGRAVVELQQMLESAGYPLPRWGADGALGDETMGAAMEAAHELSLMAPNGHTVPAQFIEALAGWLAAKEQTPEFVDDLRDEAYARACKGVRPWSSVKGIVLHQTACLLGEEPKLKLAIHHVVTRKGRSHWLHDYDETVWQANSFNSSTVGIEIDGWFEGIEGDPSTLWVPSIKPTGWSDKRWDEWIVNRSVPLSISEPQILSSRETVAFICRRVERMGGKIERIYAHRQSSKSRRSDPGSMLWREVGLWAKAEMSLEDGGDGYVHGGLPIPNPWDARRSARY